MSQHFSVMDENPNVAHSGINGCLCAEDGTADTKGPFIVFNVVETDSLLSPWPVLCSGCLCKARELVQDGVEKVEPEPPKRPRKDRGTHQLADEDGPSI